MMNKTEFKKVEDALNKKGIKCEIRTVTKNGVCPNYRHFVDDDFYCADAEKKK